MKPNELKMGARYLHAVNNDEILVHLHALPDFGIYKGLAIISRIHQGKVMRINSAVSVDTLLPVKPWKVEINCCGHWEDAEWLEDIGCGEKPMRFDCKEAAEAEIDELIRYTENAFMQGQMDERYNRRDYRAVLA